MIALNEQAEQQYFWNDARRATGTFSNSDYEAAHGSKTRTINTKPLTSEDKALRPDARKRAIKGARDLRRNFAVVRWAINKHLDFVVAHNFRAKTGNDQVDQALTDFVTVKSRKAEFDHLKRHPRRRFMRMLEAARTIDGDIFSVRRASGGVQAVEGDRIRSPYGSDATDFLVGNGDKWVHGIRVNSAGMETAIAIHKRTGKGQFELERIVQKQRTIALGYYDRFDQHRGISPITAAINPFLDVHQSFEYTLAKEKVRQLFALSIYRDADWGVGQGNSDREYEINFGDGPQFLEMEPGDRAEFLASNDPGGNTQEFWQWLISIALKSLDIPYSFFQENFTNFFGSKSALTLYLNSVRDKREDVSDWLNDWLCWRLDLAVANGEINLPANFDCSDHDQWQWIPRGLPWWDPREIKADIDAINAGLKTREQVRWETYGDSWREDVAPVLADEENTISELGLNITTGASQTIEVVNNGD